jgi:DNA polymerase (family 10)
MDELRKSLPAGLVRMLRIPGLGPKKIKILHDQLKVTDLESLRAACEAGKVAELKGFGAKSQQKILEGIAYVDTIGNRVRIDQALPLGMALLERLRRLPGVIRAELGGSLRRRRETAKDIDIVLSSDDPKPIMKAFVTMPEVIQVVGHGETKSSVVASLVHGGERITLNADLRIVDDEQFPFALLYFTGDKAHNIHMRDLAQAKGLKLNEYALAGEKRSVKAKDEADVFKALGLDWIHPELRQDTGEIEAAAEHRLPKLVEADEIRGVFHNHTTYSDGNASLELMAKAAKALGFEYLGIGDHSKSLTVANGLTEERVRQQHEEIDALNKKLKGIRILKGIECDVLADGSLDFDDEFLRCFDYVVASVHTLFGMSEKDMTARIVRAVSNPRVTMLGHPSGRLSLRRDAYKVDLDAVLDAAARHGTMVEINAQPLRLDLDWAYVKRAKGLGITLVINPDAHTTGELEFFRYGVDTARRGWLEKKDVFNTRPLAEVVKELERRKAR